MKNFAGYGAMLNEMLNTCKEASEISEFVSFSGELSEAIDILKDVTNAVMEASQNSNPDLVFSNSVAYLDMFGHIVISWLWLKQGMAAQAGLNSAPHTDDVNFYNGKLQAMKYFFASELPKFITGQL